MMQQREKRGNIARAIPDGMGPRVLARIMGDCIECPDCGEMTLWTGNNTNAMGKAVVEIDRVRYAVRRAVYQIEKGAAQIRPGLCIITTCTEQCLNHEHLQTVSKAGVVRRSVERGLLHNVLHKAAIKRARRVRADAKMNMDKARAVRASSKTLDQQAEEFAVSRQSISMILAGRTWAEDANPFAGLGSRT
jgi:hypothetical protein